MKKHYKLIISGSSSFSLSNETDADAMTDYFPGVWAISSQKSALDFAKRFLAEGNTISVTDYNNAKHHKLANYFIKELGLSQPLFPEPADLPVSVVTNGKPSTLGALKKYLTVGTKVHITAFDGDGAIRNDRDTVVLTTQSNAVTVEKTPGSGIKSWIYFNTAKEWGFDNNGATHYYQDSDGSFRKSFTISYLTA